jgi:thymidylate synthase
MIKNILANPRIRYIILCGSDLMGSGKAFISFMKNGIDENGKIIGASGYIDLNIDAKLIEKFREKVKVINMCGREAEIPNIVNDLKNLPPFIDPVFVKESKQKTSSLYSEEVVFKVQGKTIANVWLKILDIVMKFGEEKESEYGIRQKEVLDVVAVVESDDDNLAPWLSITEKDLENYFKTFFSEKKKDDVEYTYGERLFKYSLSRVKERMGIEIQKTLNQIEYIIEKLKEVPYTRRAVAFTWKHEIDVKSKSPPCLTQITWNIKNRKLYQTAIFRSHDVFGAWVLNAFALRKLQSDISKKLNVDVGSMIIISNSAHIYENNWEEAERILEKYYRKSVLPFIQDKNGYFIISIENGKIKVQHHLPDGRKSKYCFYGTKAQDLYRKILNENLISRMDHAAYLGHELARAEICLKENKKFVQDKA